MSKEFESVKDVREKLKDISLKDAIGLFVENAATFLAGSTNRNAEFWKERIKVVSLKVEFLIKDDENLITDGDVFLMERKISTLPKELAEEFEQDE